MKEVLFIKRNVEQWKFIESVVKKGKKVSPDHLAQLYVRLTDDLAYARTFYPESQATVYLNGLAALFHQKIYQNKKEKKKRFLDFFRTEVPLAVRASHPQLILSFVIFLIAISIGIVSASEDISFLRVILGDRYVDMTIANIQQGDPMGVYKSSSPFEMFIMIMFNNIKVAFTAFVFGIFFSVGTAYILFFNGIMLGAFHTFFYQYNVLGESLLTVYLHGTLEISAIIIAGGAGLCLGNSLLFPGTYSRLDALKKGARTGLKIVIGLVPVFVMAAWIEGYITRYGSMPLGMNLMIIFGSLAFILYYYVFYPLLVERRSARQESPEQMSPEFAPGRNIQISKG